MLLNLCNAVGTGSFQFGIMALKMLEPALRSRLRSGVAVASVSQCVGELVENSIDAGATCIAIRVDIPKFKIQVLPSLEGQPPLTHKVRRGPVTWPCRPGSFAF